MTPEQLAVQAGQALVPFILGVVVGALAPTYYASERLRGFGRSMFAKVPYAPPPGVEREEALRAAVDASPVDTDDDGDENGGA